MEAVIFTLVLIGILISIVSGVWVAIGLIGAISRHRHRSAAQLQADEKDGAQEIK